MAAGLLVMANGVRFVLILRHTTMDMLTYSTFTRLDGIAIGVLISVFLRGRIPSPPLGVRFLFAFLGLGGLMGASELLSGTSPEAAPTLLGGMLGYPLVGIACTLLFLSALGLRVERLRPIGWPRLVYLGKISYGLYVYHFLALLLVRSALGPLHLVTYLVDALLGFALTVALSMASYHFLELPFLKYKERFTYVLSRPE